MFLKNSTKNRFNIGIILIILFWLLVYTFVSILLVCLSNGIKITLNSNSKMLLSDLPTIVIDPGHGGFDGGAVSESGISEKDLNLGIALKLKALFSISEIPCVMTRDGDYEVERKTKSSSNKKRADLIGRTEICESIDNPLFLSIHQNKFTSGKYKGLQVFYSTNHSDSAVIASIIKENNRSLLDNSNKREIKPAGREIFVLDKLETPAVLIECGFLSNASEAEMLSTDEYQEKLALVIFKSVIQYIYK